MFKCTIHFFVPPRKYHTRKLCAKLFGAENGIEMQAYTQQQGSVDCGVHAIAVCTALTHFFSRVII